MANIKSVNIIGEIPFNAAEHYDMRKFLGVMNGPTIGIKIEYRGSAKSRPNRFPGGRTAYYKFCIHGHEAVSDGWIKGLLQALVNCGSTIDTIYVEDVDNRQQLSYSTPEPVRGNFVCELRVVVHNEEFDAHHLKWWLDKTLVVNFDEDLGTFHPLKAVSVNADVSTLNPA